MKRVRYSCAEVNCPGMNNLCECIKIDPCPAKQRELEENKSDESETRVPEDVCSGEVGKHRVRGRSMRVRVEGDTC